jgi:hypothetical protein
MMRVRSALQAGKEKKKEKKKNSFLFSFSLFFLSLLCTTFEVLSRRSQDLPSELLSEKKKQLCLARVLHPFGEQG